MKSVRDGIASMTTLAALVPALVIGLSSCASKGLQPTQPTHANVPQRTTATPQAANKPPAAPRPAAPPNPAYERLAPEDRRLLSDINATLYQFVKLDPALQDHLLVALKVIYAISPRVLSGLIDVQLAVTRDDAQAQADLTVLKREAAKLQDMLARDPAVNGLVAVMQYRPNANKVKFAFDEAVEGFQGSTPFWSAVAQVMSRPAGKQFFLVRDLYRDFAYTQYPKETTTKSAERAIVVYKSDDADSARRRLATGMNESDLFIDRQVKRAQSMIVEGGLWRGKAPPPPGCVERVAQYEIVYGRGEPFELRVPYDDCKGAGAGR